MPAAWVAGAGALIGGLSGASSSNKQAQQQKKSLKMQAQQYAQNKAMFDPYLQGGQQAMGQYMNQLGIGSGPAFDVTQLPGYQQSLKQGLAAVNQGAAGSGMLMSGERLKALQSEGQNVLGRFYDSYMDRLAGMQTQGVNAANMLAGNQGQIINQMANTRTALGDARAAGVNAWGQAASGMLGAGAGYMGSSYPRAGGSAPGNEFNFSSLYQGP